MHLPDTLWGYSKAGWFPIGLRCLLIAWLWCQCVTVIWLWYCIPKFNWCWKESKSLIAASNKWLLRRLKAAQGNIDPRFAAFQLSSTNEILFSQSAEPPAQLCPFQGTLFYIDIVIFLSLEDHKSEHCSDLIQVIVFKQTNKQKIPDVSVKTEKQVASHGTRFWNKNCHLMRHGSEDWGWIPSTYTTAHNHV